MSGTVIGWVRIELGEGQGSALAGNLRVEMRNDGGRPLVENECR